MSAEITADAVPLTDNKAHSTEGELDNCVVKESSDMERMAESSDSNSSDGQGVQSRLASFGPGSRTQNIQQQVVIQAPTGVLHLGPVYNLNVGQKYSAPSAVSQQPSSDSSGQSAGVLDNAPGTSAAEGRERPPKEEMRPLWYSKRVIEQEELALLSHNIGANWKAVGNGLKFNWAQLDQFEQDTKTVFDAVQRMLFRWIQWKDQKATVGKLTKVLFNHGEFDAIRCLKP